MFIAIIAVIVNISVILNLRPDIQSAMANFHFTITSDQAIEIQTFYKDDREFTPDQVETYEYNTPGKACEVQIPVGVDSKYIRIDFGAVSNKTILSNLYCDVNNKHLDIDENKLLQPVVMNEIENIQNSTDGIEILASLGDPWLVFSVEDMNLEQLDLETVQSRYLVYKVLLCIAVDVMALFCIYNIKTILRLPLDIYTDRDMFWDLAKNDFQARFAGSYLGIVWAFIQPFITMLLYWFVFQVGLRAGKVSEYPFILFLMSGLIPWFYFSEALSGATNALLEYSYLVKKVVFNVEILPAIKVISSIFVHLFFVAFIMIICAVYGFMPDLYYIQVFYYIICMVLLVLGISYITAACTAFMRDTAQLVNIFLTMGIWITPIMWNPVGVLSLPLQRLFQLNPIYYIVDGFRDSLLNKVWFWEKPIWTVYFWIITLLIYIVGIKMFSRLKIHFSDVL